MSGVFIHGHFTTLHPSRFTVQMQLPGNSKSTFPIGYDKVPFTLRELYTNATNPSPNAFFPFSSGYSVFHVLIFHYNFSLFNNKDRKWDSSKLGSAVIHRKFNKIDFRKGERLKTCLYLMNNAWESSTYIVQSLVT